MAAENNINIANETEYHERLHEYHSKVSGVLSSKTTDIYDYSNVVGSNVEGKDVTLNAKENLNITASETTNKLEQNSKSSSASVGVSLELGKGPSYSISGSMSKQRYDCKRKSRKYN